VTAPICPYCNAPAYLVTGDVIYPWRKDLAHKKFWKCTACVDAYVGCHPGTDNPLGRLADAKLRLAKSHAHAVFDPLWEAKVAGGMAKSEARSRGYQWLAKELGIEAKDCHIGMFDVETCHKVVTVCRPHARKLGKG
jgi:hypothetical protein